MIQTRGHWIDRIKINRISAAEVDGIRFWRKERRSGSAWLVVIANAFFKAAQNPVRLWTSLQRWQQWEIDCFTMLNGSDGFRAFRDGQRAVCAAELPGLSLSDHIDNGTISEAMFVAAAKELRRAHSCALAPFEDGWSHGDPHLANVIYDPSTSRARLIDFEVAHLRSLPVQERHADDLLVFLQDLVGLVSLDQWDAFSRCFLNAYGNVAVQAVLQRRLVVPRWGAPHVWWTIRTNYIPRAELVRRIDLLRGEL